MVTECLQRCKGPNLGFLKFKALKIRPTRTGDLAVHFQLIVPCTLSSTQPTVVTFQGLSTSETIFVTAHKVTVKGNVITGRARLAPKRTYLITSFTFNPSEPQCFTAGAGQRLIVLHE